MLGHRGKLHGGTEWDVFTRWRKVLCYTSRAGVCKTVKRAYNKRQRKLVKMEIRHA